MSSFQSLTEAIQSGRIQGMQEMAFEARLGKKEKRTETEERKLTAAFQAASDVFTGLAMLRGIPRSRFEFNTRRLRDKVYISTNIPISNGNEEGSTLSIVAEAEGRITAQGNSCEAGSDSISVLKTDRQAAEKITAFVAKYATKKGLLGSAW